MTLSEKLYELRKSKDLTQDEVAEALGVSRQAVSKWEMGTGTPTVENLVSISKFYGVTLDSLVKNGPDGSPVPPVSPAETVSYTPPPPQSFARVKPELNAAVCSAVLIVAGLFTSLLDYLLRLLMAKAGINDTGSAPFLIHFIGVISSIPLFIAYSLLFRSSSHGALQSFIGILGLSVLFHAVTFEMNFLLNIDFIPAVLDGILSVASVLLYYLAAAGLKGFENRKKSAKTVLIIFLTVYFLYLITSRFAATVLLGNYIENSPEMSYGRLLFTLSTVSSAASFLLDMILKPVALSVFYCGIKPQ